MVKVNKHSVLGTGKENVMVYLILYLLLTCYLERGIVLSAGLTGKLGDMTNDLGIDMVSGN